MISVKIISAGCSKCRKLESMILALLEKHNIEVDLEKIVDIQEMTKYGFVLLPALIINGKVKSHGYVPKEEQIISWLNKG